MTADPRVSNRVMVCRDCGAPLEIVCPTHGRTVSRVVESAATSAPKQPRAPRVPRDRSAPTLQQRIAAFIAQNTDAQPCTPAKIADRFGITTQHVSVYLTHLVKAGAIARVGKGLYTGPVA